MTCDTNCPYRTLNRCTVTGRDVRDLERCPPVSELIKEDDGFAERIAHAWRGSFSGVPGREPNETTGGLE